MTTREEPDARRVESQPARTADAPCPTSEREVAALAEDELAAAAESDLRDRAEENTRERLTSLAYSLGYSDVTVRFDAADGL